MLFPASALQLRPSRDQCIRLYPDCCRHLQQVRFMRFEECQGCGKQASLSGTAAELIRGQTGEVKEPQRAPFVGQGCGQCGKGDRFGIAGRFICRVA